MKKLILPTRRKLIGGLGALIAAPYVAKSAFFQGAINGPSGIQGKYSKPTGTPTYIGGAAFPGMLLYGFDTGTGVYATVLDCATGPQHPPDPTTSVGSPANNYFPGAGTPFDPKPQVHGSTTCDSGNNCGNAQLWDGTLQKPGYGTFFGGGVGEFDYPDTGPGGSPLRDAVNLQAAGTGASFIMFATFMQTANTPGGSIPIIFGRGCALDTPNYVCALTVAPSGSQLNFNWSNSNGFLGNGQNLPMIGSMSLNTLHTAVAHCLNTSAGVTQIDLYLDGTLVGTQSGATMFDVSANNCQMEDQLQVAALFHVYAGQSDLGWAGSVYQVGIANPSGGWSMPAAALSLSNNPYQMLK